MRLRPVLAGIAVVVALGAPSFVGRAGAAPTDTAPSTDPASAIIGVPGGDTSATSSAGAATPAGPTPPVAPTVPGATPPTTVAGSGAKVSIDLGSSLGKPSQSLTIIIALTLLAVAPALLMMLTGFTRIVIVLSLTRNALGLQSIPPNQVVVGLALFLALFTMAPTLSDMNKNAVQPYLNGKINQSQAYDNATGPLRTFMMRQTHKSELAMFVKASATKPQTSEDVSMSALVPAFILSEIKTAFIIGFVIFIPFLVIDILVSSSLMSMGMMMLPPVLVSMPFKILLFVMVDGWALVVRSLLTSFR